MKATESAGSERKQAFETACDEFLKRVDEIVGWNPDWDPSPGHRQDWLEVFLSLG